MRLLKRRLLVMGAHKGSDGRFQLQNRHARLRLRLFEPVLVERVVDGQLPGVESSGGCPATTGEGEEGTDCCGVTPASGRRESLLPTLPQVMPLI